MNTVALYLRKSRDEDFETREETLARHERMLLDYCRRNNLIIKHIYKEIVTGENLQARPQARAMLEAVSNGEYDGVVVVELERLSRGNQIDQVEILDTFKYSKTKIYTLNKIYDLSSDNEFDEEFFEFGLFMSRREYKTIKRRLIRGKKQAQQEGYYIGSSLPYGFGKVRGDRGYILTPNEETPIVQMIFNKFVYENYSLADLRHFLDGSGIKPQRSEHWNGIVIKNILKNKCYIGYINYNSRSKRTQQCYKGKHEPIIDIHTFEMAQQKLAISSHKLNRKNTLQNPLASLVKCSRCGATMQKINQYFRCITPKCKTVLSYFEDVEKQIIFELQNELAGFNYFIENYGTEIEKQNKITKQECSILEQQIKQKEQMLDKACELLEMGVYTLEKYQSRVNTLENEKKALESQINALNDTDIQKVNQVRKAVPILEQCLVEYWNLNAQSKNDLLKSIIDKVEYSKTKRNGRWHKTGDMKLKIYLKI